MPLVQGRRRTLKHLSDPRDRRWSGAPISPAMAEACECCVGGVGQIRRTENRAAKSQESPPCSVSGTAYHGSHEHDGARSSQAHSRFSGQLGLRVRHVQGRLHAEHADDLRRDHVSALRLGAGPCRPAPTLLIVTLATAITLLTALSLSALATNMRVGGGGAYYIISRSLGLEAGAAIGLPLFLAQSLGISFYVAGFAELARVRSRARRRRWG